MYIFRQRDCVDEDRDCINTDRDCIDTDGDYVKTDRAFVGHCAGCWHYGDETRCWQLFLIAWR